jgi:hypothetical protein
MRVKTFDHDGFQFITAHKVAASDPDRPGLYDSCSSPTTPFSLELSLWSPYGNFD